MSEINSLRGIFRQAPYENGGGFHSVPVQMSENSGPKSTLLDSRDSHDSTRDSHDSTHDFRDSAAPISSAPTAGERDTIVSAPVPDIDKEARLTLERLAKEGGGWDPRRVTIPKAREALRRGQEPTRLLVKAWKNALASTRPAVPARQESVADLQAFDRVRMLLPNPSPAQEAADSSTARIAAFIAFATTFIELVGRPAGAAEIYDTAVLVYPVSFGRPNARQVLEEHYHGRLTKTSNGQYWLKDSAISADARPEPVRYHSRRPSTVRAPTAETKSQAKQKRDLARRTDFGDFAAEHLLRIGYPAGPYELYDAAKEAGKSLDFARDSARDILIRARHPKLRKLRNGTFWLADRSDAPEPPSGPYFNRKARLDYPALGQELVAILRARRSWLTTPELKDRLSQRMRAALPSYHPSYSFSMAAKHFPQLRLKDSYWRLIDLPEDRPRGLSLDQEAAIYAIDICNVRGPSTVEEITARLPRYLVPLIDLAESLERIAPSFPSLQQKGTKWTVDATKTIFARNER
ncbi:hypothetical protein [Bradyrhizobium diazoefficiens]|uniref:hypothetical protein n=1 Tax=Bradyrhizobium diazoefficiens TaxID=1355477 RepID=UPI002714D9BD|nr:hypothetical protein [Bradyrhizobium diazoefficiens]WLB37994.1 hypothetical protein QIH78_42785 [Bradyrhizobium diazoefficiens]WLC17121.1 hypothetical protein QIH76_01500 [Bradyrhizobium diazoefficiens]